MRTDCLTVVMVVVVNAIACGPAVRCGAGTMLVGNECVADVGVAEQTDAGVAAQDGGSSVPDGGVADAGERDAGRAELPDGGCTVLTDDHCVGDIAAHCYSRRGGGLTQGSWQFDDCGVYGGTCVKNASGFGATCTGGLYSEPCTRPRCVTNTIFLICGVGGPNGPNTCANRCLTSNSGYTNCVAADTELCDPDTFSPRCSNDGRSQVYCARVGFTETAACRPNEVCRPVDAGTRCGP